MLEPTPATSAIGQEAQLTPRAHFVSSPAKPVGARLQGACSDSRTQSLPWVIVVLAQAILTMPAAATSGGSIDSTESPATRSMSAATSSAPFHVSGRVVRPDGTPAEGVEVEWSEESSHSAEGERTFTDHEGRFEVEAAAPGRIRVVAGASPSAVEVDEAGPELLFTMPEQCPSRLQVVDSSGAGVSGYAFGLNTILQDRQGDIDFVSVGTYETDSDGWVSLPDLLCGAFSAVRRRPEQSPIRSTQLDSTVSQELQIQVARGTTLHGSLVDDSGSPIANQSVRFSTYEDGVTVTTDADGAFEVVLPTGQDASFSLRSKEFGRPSFELRSPRSDEWAETWVVERPRVVHVVCEEPSQCERIGYATCAVEEPREPFDYGNCWWDGSAALECTCPRGDVLVKNLDGANLAVPADVDSVVLAEASMDDTDDELVTVSTAIAASPSPDLSCLLTWESKEGTGRVPCSHGEAVSLALPVDVPVELSLSGGGLRRQKRTVTAFRDSTNLPPLGIFGTGHASFTLVDAATGEAALDAFVSLYGLSGDAKGMSIHLLPGMTAGGIAEFDHLPSGRWKASVTAESGSLRVRLNVEEGTVVHREVLVGRKWR